jgi:hypothetical protein
VLHANRTTNGIKFYFIYLFILFLKAHNFTISCNAVI